MLTLLLALAACGHENVRVPMTPVVAGRPVIVHLVNREHVVSITSGPDGPLYSANTKGGIEVATGLTLHELRQHYPDVYRKLHPAISADASARVD